MSAARILGLVGVYLLALPSPALAYLDPGTGSMLLSALIGLVATVFFMLKALWYKSASFWYRLRGLEAPSSRGDIVFYSEGRQYWATFKPIVEALEKRGAPLLYLSSDSGDPGLADRAASSRARCIGKGSRAFALLNLLEADICVLTTPGLDVLQIRRSPGVAHYSHMVHAITDMAFYKLYSFDYFDSILLGGPHQSRSLRWLESLRGTPPKMLLETGCPYMDVLASERGHEAEEKTACDPPPELHGQAVSSERQPEDQAGKVSGKGPGMRPALLVAPTWGRNGLLTRFGLELLQPLADAGFRLCIRPHPQSSLAEPGLLRELQAALAKHQAVSWDFGPSPFAAMQRADVLLSDLSGIVFDFALIFEKPVLTMEFTPDLRGQEANDLPWRAWELEILPRLGQTLCPADIPRLPEIIAGLPPAEVFVPAMRSLRAASLYNFKRSGEVAAGQLLAIQAGIRARREEGRLPGAAAV